MTIYILWNSPKENSIETTENNTQIDLNNQQEQKNEKEEYNTREYIKIIDLISIYNTIRYNDDDDDDDDINKTMNLLIIKQRFQSSLKKFLLTTSINDIEILRDYIQTLHCKYKTKKYELDLIIISKILFNIDYLKENNYDLENNYNIVNDFIKKINIKDLENKNLIIDITNFFINSICLVV